MLSIALFVCLVSLHTEAYQKNIPIKKYDDLLTHLTNGASVMYFFNTTTCQPISSAARNVDLPVFGGEISFFLTTKSSAGSAGQLVFNQENYEISQAKGGMVTEKIQSIYIVEDTAMILYGMSGVFANNTNNIKGVICNWTSGDDNKFWTRNPITPSQLSSFEQIRSSVADGNPLRFVITINGCRCSSGNNCGHGYVGGDIKGIKVSSDGSLSFSNAMTLYFPVPTSPMYYRELLVGNIQRNNTAGFSLYYLNATTWEIENGVDLDCSIEQSRGHADFFSIV
uniref:Uncharacterized protein LOC111109002 n=1 Tax=Crassostrea virginica TaxID=6565 RepID=A0A8B8BBK3_CRAVI|nr:uncharacterized protein LOC111109002 [Crassostrea virginica]